MKSKLMLKKRLFDTYFKEVSVHTRKMAIMKA